MKFKEVLKELRLRKGLTQEQLAGILHIPDSNIRRYESKNDGLPTIERLIKIADFFGVTIDQLIGREEIENKLMDIINLSDEHLTKVPMYFGGIELTLKEKRDFLAIAQQILSYRKDAKENP